MAADEQFGRKPVNKDSKKSREWRPDGWTNVYNGLGVQGMDPRRNNVFLPTNQLLSEAAIRAMISGGGLAANIVDITVEECLREGFRLIGDTEDAVNGVFDSKGIHKGISNLFMNDLSYGGAVAVIGIGDGQADISLPLNEDNLSSLEFLKTYDRWRVTWKSTDLYADPTKPKYGMPEKYMISPLGGAPFTIHESRLLIGDGLWVPDLTRWERMLWGDSIIVRVYDALMDLGTAYTDIGDIIHDFITAVMSLKELMETVRLGNTEEVIERVRIIRETRAIANVNLIDSEETYQKHSSTVTGLSDLVNTLKERAASEARMPVTLLFGRSAAGMNATGEGENTNWENRCRGLQKKKVQAWYERLISLLVKCKKFPEGKALGTKWKIQWNPLSNPSEKDIAQTRLNNAQADHIYIQDQVLDPEEVRSRFSGDVYSNEIELIEGSKPWENPPPGGDPNDEPIDKTGGTQ